MNVEMMDQGSIVHIARGKIQLNFQIQQPLIKLLNVPSKNNKLYLNCTFKIKGINIYIH